MPVNSTPLVRKPLGDRTAFGPDHDVAPPASVNSNWSLGVRLAFRFCFVYFGLYIGATQLLTSLVLIPKLPREPLDTYPPIRTLVAWTATHVFHLSDFVTARTGSSDRLFDWVEVFVFLCIAAMAMIVWSVVDRRRANYDRLNRWFRLFVRFALAATIMEYGSWKVFALQMAPVRFAQLLQPLGAFSPEGLLWAFMGAAPAYEVATGAAEVLAGALMFVPRLSTLGTLICLADALQVFALNMTYDVPVKLMSFHLILLSLFLLAPYARRFSEFFVLGRQAEPVTEVALFADSRANRRAVAVQLIVGAWLVVMPLWGSLRNWERQRQPNPPFYGVWNVTAMSVDGVQHPAVLSDSARWRRVIFEGPRMVLQGMDERQTPYTAMIDTSTRVITLHRRSDKLWNAQLKFEHPADGDVRLEGDLDAHHVRAELRRVPGFLLVDRGFHWIQERPFHR
jgi:hypothetical protein